jgi:catechol 2,3-dioxygenase-like lactoylglutathione lyase family enzyme
MSRFLGEVRQVAYVTDDMSASLEFLTETCGIGPWFVARDFRIADVRHRGTPTDLSIDIAIGNSGGLQFEVIQPHGPGPSIYQEFLDRYPGGFVPQHFSSWVADFEEAVANARARGFVPVLEGTSGFGSFIYMQTPAQPDFTFEITEFTPARRSVFDQIRLAAVNWDGADPVRSGLPKPQLG